MSNGADRKDAAPPYVLGHSEQELERLSAQAQMVAPFTKQLFCDAGIVPGMRVLDVGSGAGDVALLVAELIGKTGEVIGTDRASAAIAAASRAAAVRSLGNVHFREGDPAEMAFEQPFDAVVGRYVLLYAADRSLMLRQLARHLRPGGAIVFHEPDWSCVRSVPPAPLYDRCCRWIIETGNVAGTPWMMADRLHAAFVGADLPAPTMRMETFIGGGAGAGGHLRWVVDATASLLPAMERLGVATASEVDLPTLLDRLLRDVAANDSIIMGRSDIGAWARRE